MERPQQKLSVSKLESARVVLMHCASLSADRFYLLMLTPACGLVRDLLIVLLPPLMPSISQEVADLVILDTYIYTIKLGTEGTVQCSTMFDYVRLLYS